MINNLSNIIGMKVKKLFLVVWPPYGEKDKSQIDISVGCVFENDQDRLFIISTDVNDLTIPLIKYQSIPKNYFAWSEFDQRMKNWMDCMEDLVFDVEFYDLTRVDSFQKIVHQEVLDIELIKIENGGIIGIKLIFENDFILSTPINDGNTIETMFFNQKNNIKNFASLGKIEYLSIKKDG